MLPTNRRTTLKMLRGIALTATAMPVLHLRDRLLDGVIADGAPRTPG